MVDTNEEATQKAPLFTLATAASFLAEQLGVKGVIILTDNPNTTVNLIASGVNHYRANEMLSLGIHLNLSQHDAFVLAGAAGAAAQQHAQEIEQSNKEAEQ